MFRQDWFRLLVVLVACWVSTAATRAQASDVAVTPAQSSADAQNVRLLSQIGGSIDALFVIGARMYVGEGYRLAIVDTADPSQPVVLGKSAFLPDLIEDLVVVGEHAYVADDYGGLRILDVSNPALPTEVGNYAVDGINRVTVVEQLAFVTESYDDGGGNLHIVNIQNPAAPVLVGKYASPEDVGAVAVLGSLVYFNDRTGLRLIDISNPAQPTETGFFPANGRLYDFQVHGNHAYLAVGENGLRILDLTNPTQPQEISLYDSPGNASDVYVNDTQAYLADGTGGLRVLDVSQPAAPTPRGVYTSTASVKHVWAVGKQVYALDSLNRLVLINSADPAQPARLGAYAAPAYAEDLYVADSFSNGRLAYVAGGNGLTIVKLDDPAGPTVVGQGAIAGGAYGIAGANDYSYIAASENGLRIVDVRDPTNPREVGFFDTPGNALDVKLLGGDAYVADGGHGLRIIDVRNPTRPTEVGFFNVYSGFCCDVWGLNIGFRDINTTYVYLADGDLRIVDVTNRAAPRQVGFLRTPGHSLAVVASGDYAYLLESDHFLRVINVSNPAAPVQVAALRYQQSGAITYDDDISVRGNEAYISDGYGVLRIFNITNPSAPVEIAYYDTKLFYANALYVIDKTIYWAGGSMGLLVMHYPACYELTLSRTGRGANPLITPDNSPGCPAGQFVPQAFVTLTANPALEWSVGSWLGTDNDATTLTTNKLTMPAADYAVRVNYVTPCYPLTLSHSGTGSAPTATPANSAVCPPGQYRAGEALSLHASPANGWRVAQWSGAATPSSTSLDNTLIMPANAHTASVTYSEIPVTAAGDAFEEDNSCTQARTLTADGVSQEHTFHRPADEDWLQVATVAGERYRIEVTLPPQSPTDASLEVYNECAGALVHQFNESFAPGVRLDITRTVSAPLYLRLRNSNAAVGGNTFTYQVSVRLLNRAQNTAAVNRALILVGGTYGNPERLQKNINSVTDAVYTYFRANGYSGADITYLSNDSNVVNRTGSATLEALQSAITVWAKQRLTVGGQITLYLMDHGDQDKFYLDNSNNQVLTPQQLDGWLSQLEAAIPELRVTVIIEACHSGSFIEGDQSISKSKPGRLVLTSTSAPLLAYASANGAYFSDFMVAAWQQGYSLHNSFKASYGSVRELSGLLQEPWLDGNGNGIPNEPADITLASQRSTDTDKQSWSPYIVSAQGPTTIVNQRGILQATVRDDKQVRRVWAVIKPPSYRPPEQSSELVAETLPTIVLSAQGNERFAAEYPGFDQLGVYRIAIYAEDDENLVALPQVINVVNGSQIFLPVVGR